MELPLWNFLCVHAHFLQLSLSPGGVQERLPVSVHVHGVNMSSAEDTVATHMSGSDGAINL